MSEREDILARVREALRDPAPRPGRAHGGDRDLASRGAMPQGVEGDRQDACPTGLHPAKDPRSWLPISGETFDQRLALFRRNAIDLKADFHLVPDLPQATALLRALRDSEGWKKAGSDGGKLTEPICQNLGLPLCRTCQAYEVRDLENCSVGITECDALVAQTGSVLLTSRSAGGRALSVLPPHHVVLARGSQLLADLPDALALLKKKYAPDYPSFISFITGPSRTGDIERILVLGAHGPKKLTIILLQEL
jgi:L-lactate dehydrogenase complex protein LldG